MSLFKKTPLVVIGLALCGTFAMTGQCQQVICVKAGKEPTDDIDIRLDHQGGTSTIDQIECTCATSYFYTIPTSIPCPTKENAVFLGYFFTNTTTGDEIKLIDSDGNSLHSEYATRCNVPAPDAFYAKWEESKLTAEDVAKEFNDNIDLYCNGGINPKLVGDDSVSSTWATASNQYSQLDEEEKSKFNGTSEPFNPSEITDLTGCTWVANDIVSQGPGADYSLNFTSNNTTFIGISIGDVGGTYIEYLGVDNKWQAVGVFSGRRPATAQIDTNFKTIKITGGGDRMNSTLIEWLTQNGTLTKPSLDPEIQEFLNKYDYLYQRYGNNTEMKLDNFLDRPITPNASKSNLFTLKEVNSSTWIIVAVSLIGLTAIGALIFYKKRKEY